MLHLRGILKSGTVFEITGRHLFSSPPEHFSCLMDFEVLAPSGAYGSFISSCNMIRLIFCELVSRSSENILLKVRILRFHFKRAT